MKEDEDFEFTFIAKAIGIVLVLIVATLLLKGLVDIFWRLVESGVL